MHGDLVGEQDTTGLERRIELDTEVLPVDRRLGGKAGLGGFHRLVDLGHTGEGHPGLDLAGGRVDMLMNAAAALVKQTAADLELGWGKQGVWAHENLL